MSHDLDWQHMKLAIRRDTEAAWLKADPVLADKEIMAVVDLEDRAIGYKVGDGKSQYSRLPFDEPCMKAFGGRHTFSFRELIYMARQT